MALTPQQKADIHRLRDNEMLTGNLTDASARAVLAWGEDQIAAGMSYDAVVAGIKAANRTGTEDPALALTAATTMLAAIEPPAGAAFALSPASGEPPGGTNAEPEDMDTGSPLPTSHEGPDDVAEA